MIRSVSFIFVQHLDFVFDRTGEQQMQTTHTAPSALERHLHGSEFTESARRLLELQQPIADSDLDNLHLEEIAIYVDIAACKGWPKPNPSSHLPWKNVPNLPRHYFEPPPVPVDLVRTAPPQRQSMFESLTCASTRVIGQDAAIRVLDEMLKAADYGLIGGRGKPKLSLLIAGPTGVGKTETAKAIAECLYGSKDRIARINLNEFRDETAVFHAFGAPRGYRSDEQGGALINAVMQLQGRCVILIDECEKGGTGFLRAMLTALDEGYLEDRRTCQRVSLEEAVVVFTTNALARIDQLDQMPEAALREQLLNQRIDGEHVFAPEFLGRLDRVLGYAKLNDEALGKIVLNRFEQDCAPRVRQGRLGISLELSRAAARIVARSVNKAFGVRNLDRAMYELLLAPLLENECCLLRQSRYVWDVDASDTPGSADKLTLLEHSPALAG
ncbi:MAG: ATP-dependent Clp protease ATP-binding subunit [Burkholderiaceae bacterium]|nr:ATP-dependent Clp protease ATP-binding subunit [Burkholderiaceae bacterium]